MRKMSRFYAIESTPSSTGAKADHRLPAKAGGILGVAREIMAQSFRRPRSLEVDSPESAKSAINSNTS